MELIGIFLLNLQLQFTRPTAPLFGGGSWRPASFSAIANSLNRKAAAAAAAGTIMALSKASSRTVAITLRR